MAVRHSLGQALLLAAAMVSVAWASEAFRPRERIADTKPKIELEEQVPKRFGDWVVDRSLAPILPSPDVQERLDALYSAILARTYVNPAGQRVMLTIAYGTDQSSEATAVHRPEFCYSSQGFRVRGAGASTVQLPDGRGLEVQRLIATQGRRFEPITYWITIDEEVTLPGIGRKVEQIRYGLKGQIPDGMLVRLSTVGMEEADSRRVQAEFIRALFSSMDGSIRSRYFGA